MGDKQIENESPDMSDVQNGPLTQANRQCRDIFCCLLFLAAMVLMVILSIYGYTNGNLDIPWRGVDQDGSICGDSDVSSLTRNFRYVYYYSPKASTGSRVCVDSCPALSGGSITTPNTKTGTIAWNYQADADGVLTPSTPEPTSSQTVGYDTEVTLDRFCTPTSNLYNGEYFKSARQTFKSTLNEGDLGNFFSDTKNNWQYLLVGLAFAIVTGFIFMFLMRCLAGCIIWFALFAVVFLFLGLGLIFLYQSGEYFGGASGAASYMGVPESGSPHSEVYGWICISFSILFLIVILCCCSRIRLAVAVCKCAAQFVGSVCLVLLVPIFQAILAIVLWACAIVAMIYLISAAKFTANSGDYVSGVESYSDEALVRFYFFVLLTLWVNAFIGAMTIFVIASATVMWYYSHGPGQELELPIARSYKMVFRFYMGSLAFGALLVALVQAIQMIFQLFKKKAEAEAGDNCCIKCLTCFISCCLACVQCIVKFINTQAYIQIAIRGKSFCYAAKDGFELAWANAARFAIVGGVGTVIAFIGKLAIAATAAICFYLMITQTSLKDEYLQPVYQVILVFIIGWIIGLLFMSIYSVAMDALLQCFLVDEANSRGKGSKKPKYAPEELAELMEKDDD